MTQLVLIFSETYEDDDDDSSDDGGRRKKKIHTGPLMLEQYEAQIQSVLTS